MDNGDAYYIKTKTDGQTVRETEERKREGGEEDCTSSQGNERWVTLSWIWCFLDWMKPSVQILRFDGNRGKAEQKSADRAVKCKRPQSRKMALLKQVLFGLSLSGAYEYSLPEEGRWNSWDILWREKSPFRSVLRPCQSGDFTHFISLNSTWVTDNYIDRTEGCQTD